MTSPDFFALLMGADCYLPNYLPGGSYPCLKGCVRDVTMVETFLRSRLSLSDDHLVKLTSTNDGTDQPKEPARLWPTYQNMVAAFLKIGEMAKKGDHVYIHYSGHGGRVRPTLLAAVKGTGAFDEALVPVDIGNSTARYLRDVEIAKLLQELTNKELLVTVVFDSCHSGGAVRSIDTGVRGVEFIDDASGRPAESDVGTSAELRGAWLSAVGGEGMRSLTSAAAAPAYNLLAACLPSEKANEFSFEGNQRNGALTYWLLDALRGFDECQTFKMVYDRVLAKVHTQFPSQTPVLVGDPGRFLFDGRTSQPTYTTLVTSVDADAQHLTLAAGLTTAVGAGAEFAVYPRTATDLSRPEGRSAVVRLTEVRDAESRAEVLETFGGAKPDAGDQAVLLAAAVTLRRRVKFVDADGKPAPANDPHLLPVRQVLPGNGWVEAVEGTDSAGDYAVRVARMSRSYEICSADGSVVPLRPDLPVGGDSPAKLIRRLVHLAKYRAWSELENKAPRATLQRKLTVELLSLPKDFNPNRLPWFELRPFADPIPSVAAGQWFALRVTNKSARTVNVTVLDLQPDWGISLIYPPGGDFEEVDPESDGAPPLVIPFQTFLPANFDRDEGIDTLKVIATFHPVRLRASELPPLDNPLPEPTRTRSMSGDPLERLLAAIDSSEPKSRSVAAFSLPGKEWASAQFSVHASAASESGIVPNWAVGA